MRVIRGLQKGRKLKVIKNARIRPATDKVKEAIFNTLNIDLEIEGLEVLDVFAGTGSLGIEALSRGASFCLFIERNDKALEVINENINICSFRDHARAVKNDALKGVKYLTRKGQKFDLIFIDPPYNDVVTLKKVLKEVDEGDLLKDNGDIVIEVEAKTDLQIEYINIEQVKEKSYGQTKILYFKRKAD